MPVKPIPEGYRTITPYMMVDGGKKLLEFLKNAFRAEVLSQTESPEGKIMNAEVRIGDSMLMLADSAMPFAPMPSSIYLYVIDTDDTYRRALDAGATSVMEPGDQFYGDRNAGVKDPVGNYWWIATHVEDVPPEEMERRAKEHMKKRG